MPSSLSLSSSLLLLILQVILSYADEEVLNQHGNGIILDNDGPQKPRNKANNAATPSSVLPVVLWHGMGDSCCNPLSMGYIKKLIRTNVPGGNVYVNSIMLGSNIAEDVAYGFFDNMNQQVQSVCDQLRADPKLSGGYNAIGFSQGGLFLRALAQRCPNPPIRNLISIGGPQQGVYGLPHCPGTGPICNTIRHLLDYGAYERIVQNTVVQAQYWHDPNQKEDYRHKNIFLANLNCELQCNKTYKPNLLKIRNFVMVQFLKDQMIQPKESAWFGFYADNQTGTVMPMEQTRIYQQDLIGLKTLKESGRLHFLAINDDHLRIPTEVFVSEIIEKYLIENGGEEGDGTNDESDERNNDDEEDGGDNDDTSEEDSSDADEDGSR